VNPTEYSILYLTILLKFGKFLLARLQSCGRGGVIIKDGATTQLLILTRVGTKVFAFVFSRKFSRN
jgi:hypothetical protein